MSTWNYLSGIEISTKESWFLFNLLNENEIGLNYWKVWQIKGILIAFDEGRGDSFSSNNMGMLKEFL